MAGSTTPKKEGIFLSSASDFSDKNPALQEEDLAEDLEPSLLSTHFKTFLIGFLNESVSIDIQIFKSEAHLYTTRWLTDQARTKLEATCTQKEIAFCRSFDSLLTLQTKSKQIVYDYLLTTPETCLDKFPDKLELIPFFSTLKFQSVNPFLKQKKTSISDFEIYAKLGRGGFSTVYVGRKKDTGKIYAIKQIKKGIGRSKEVEHQAILNEKIILIALKQTLKVKLHYTFQTKYHYYFVMDYLAGGSMRNLVQRKGPFSEEQVKIYVAETLSDLIQIHDRKIIYRDLKSDNLLLDYDGHVHISDFGTAKQLDPRNPVSFSMCGTQETMAPEVIQGNGYTFTADYYGLGILAYELICGNPPFYRKKTREDIFSQVLNETPVYPKQVSENMRDFMKKLLLKTPDDRLGARGYEEIMKHPWLADVDFTKVRARSWPPSLEIAPALSDLKYKKAHHMLTQSGDGEEEIILISDTNDFQFTYDTENNKNVMNYKEITRFSAFSELKPDFGRHTKNYRFSLTTESSRRPSIDTINSGRVVETNFSEKKETNVFRRAKFAALEALQRVMKKTKIFDIERQEEYDVPSDSENKSTIPKSYYLKAKINFRSNGE